MFFRKELAEMQRNYEKKRLQDIKLKRPHWLRYDDPISEIFEDKQALFQKGDVSFAHIVQANTVLFKFFPHVDCPAYVVYSTTPSVAENPAILKEVAYFLYSYKNAPLESVPEEWREIARVITDEYDRSKFSFSINYNEQYIEIHLISVLIFRKLLPKKKLCGSLLPILTTPGRKTVIVLPKRYWTKEFKKAWCKGLI